MKYFLEYLPVRSKRYTVRALARTLANSKSLTKQTTDTVLTESSETGRHSVKVWGRVFEVTRFHRFS